MVNYKESATRAKETSTFRFTSYEKRLLAYLAELQGMTQTALIRALLAERAEQMGVNALPEPPKRRKPGRPKKNVSTEAVPDETQTPTSVATPAYRSPAPERLYIQSHVATETFGELIVKFQDYFRMRSEKMQRELENTIRFVTGITGEMVLLPPEWLLGDIDAPLLADVRERIKDAEMRFPQKNLHLTYLRMMFNFAVKEGMLSEDTKPMETLRSFTAKEVADAFPLPIKTI